MNRRLNSPLVSCNKDEYISVGFRRYVFQVTDRMRILLRKHKVKTDF